MASFISYNGLIYNISDSDAYKWVQSMQITPPIPVFPNDEKPEIGDTYYVLSKTPTTFVDNSSRILGNADSKSVIKFDSIYDSKIYAKTETIYTHAFMPIASLPSGVYPSNTSYTLVTNTFNSDNSNLDSITYSNGLYQFNVDIGTTSGLIISPGSFTLNIKKGDTVLYSFADIGYITYINSIGPVYTGEIYDISIGKSSPNNPDVAGITYTPTISDTHYLCTVAVYIENSTLTNSDMSWEVQCYSKAATTDDIISVSLFGDSGSKPAYSIFYTLDGSIPKFTWDTDSYVADTTNNPNTILYDGNNITICGSSILQTVAVYRDTDVNKDIVSGINTYYYQLCPTGMALDKYANDFDNLNIFRSLSMSKDLTEQQSLRDILLNRLWAYYYMNDADITYISNSNGTTDIGIDSGSDWADLSVQKYMPVCRFYINDDGSVSSTWAVWATTDLKSYVEPYFSSYKKCVDAINNVIMPFMTQYPQFEQYLAIQ